MILGLSSGLEHKTPEEWAKKHKELGCLAINFPLTCDDDPKLIDQYANVAAKEGLIIAEVGVWRNTLASDVEERNANISYAVRQLKMADKIGAKCCVNIIGTPHGPRWDGAYAGNYSEQTYNMAIQMIQYIIDEAKPKYTKYSIETMPWMIPSSPDEYVKMITDVNRKEFGVHLDFINMVNCPQRYFFAEDFLNECFTKLKGKIISCHLKDVVLLDDYTFQLRECACGEGTMPLELYAKLATKEKSQMPMIIEHLNTDQEYIDSLNYVKKRLANYIK